MTSLIRAFRLGLLNLDFFRHVLFKDAKSGLVVGIIALPMSVGIALASGFPPFAGLVTSLVGGLLVSLLGGSRLCIKGPAGGLSALTLSSVLVLGNGDLQTGYSLTLAAIIMGGIFQILSAFARMGNLGDFFPAAAIHGMLAGLGFIMAVKQLPPMLGLVDSSSSVPELLHQLPSLFFQANPKVAGIGLLCLMLLVGYEFLPASVNRTVPAVILMLILVLPLGMVLGLGQLHTFEFWGKMFEVSPVQHLVPFPSDFLSTLRFPDFGSLDNLNFWVFAFIFSLAGNIESLLTCKAVDQIDPWHRQTNYNQDLMAIGIGNIVCGFLGGLPMISESKRSVVNIRLGASTFASNFFHAFFLLLIILLAQPFIRLIPVTALAAFLIFTGVKMALPKEFSKSYRIGKEQFVVFVVVFLLTVYTNLLFGVLAGTLLELIINMRFGATSSSLFESNVSIEEKSPFVYEAKIEGPATFSNFLWVKKELSMIPDNASIQVDFSKATVVDHSFMENLGHFEANREHGGGSITITGFDYHQQVSEHPLAARRIIQGDVTVRQKELQYFAEIRSYEFDSRKLGMTEKYTLHPLAQKITVHYQENTIRLQPGKWPYEIADVHFELRALSKQSFNVSVVSVTGLAAHIPAFILQMEGFEKKLLDIENCVDINFTEFPVFSYYYFLTGENEKEIRSFFTSEVIDFFEKSRGYNLSVSSNQLLLYKKTNLLTTEELSRMILFAEEFLLLTDK